MSMHTFAYIILTGLALLSAYAMGVSSVEPSLEDQLAMEEEGEEPGTDSTDTLE